MEIEMKRLTLVTLLSLVVLPLTAYAQERMYDETVFVMRNENFQSFEDVLGQCAWAIPYLPMDVGGGWSSELYAVTSSGTDGKISGKGEKIADMWTCFDSGQEIVAPVGPSYEQAIAYAIFIDGETLGALGIVRPRNGQEEYPLYGTMASVSRVVDDVPGETIGALTMNELIDPANLYGGTNGVVVLRLFEPRNYDQEALIEALRRAFGFDGELN
jgi:hypothetical protein